MRAVRYAALVLGTLPLVLLSGCSTTLGDLPLPGTGVSGETITVTADFDEALNLAQGAAVKVDGVDSGKVQEVTAENFSAKVTMLVTTDAELREGATARLRYTTPLGELFVDVTNPTDGPLLADGAELTDADTTTAPTVEDALAQASLLVNGGGLSQLQTVTEELRAALDGREDVVRSALERSTDVLDQLDAATGDVDRALRDLDSLAGTLRDRQDTINGVLRDVRPAARVLQRSTPQLARLLSSVEDFADVADRTVRDSREDLLTSLREVAPVLEELADNDGRLQPSLRALVRLADVLHGVTPGDYLNISFDLQLDQGVNGGLPGLPDLPGILGDLLDGIGDSIGGLLGRADQEVQP